MYKIGDRVLYGTKGVCEIRDVTTLDIDGIDKDRLYYVLHPRENEAKIYIPVDGADAKLRKLISKDEAEELISKIKVLEPLEIKDDKKPEIEYRDALQKYDCEELLKLIKCIYHRRKKRIDEGKKSTVADDKYMRLAEDMLYQEFGDALDIPKEHVVEYIVKAIDE